MSSHREAPAISQDPVADNTDTYAFVSPDDPDTVTIIANYLPLEAPFGGPNFFEFGDDVLYKIHIDNNGDGKPDITYQFQFKTEIRNPNTFLYNTGPITSIDSPNWNRRQFYSVTRIKDGTSTVLWRNSSPVRRATSVRRRRRTTKRWPPRRCTTSPADNVFAGQRLDGFYVDLGAIFDLGDLRPFQNLHIASMAAAHGVDATHEFGVHSIALKIPKRQLTSDASQANRPDVADLGNRGVGRGQSPAGTDSRGRWRHPGKRSVGPGVPARQPAVQRGHRADGRKGRLERGRAGR